MMKSDWIRTMRNKMGLKGFQLAEQLQVSAARVSVLEKDESRGAVTLKMMDRAAKAMGCKFEYRIVPALDNERLSSTKTKTDPYNEKPRFRVVVK